MIYLKNYIFIVGSFVRGCLNLYVRGQFISKIMGEKEVTFLEVSTCLFNGGNCIRGLYYCYCCVCCCLV